jgi:small subunit ribosomal protein S1
MSSETENQTVPPSAPAAAEPEDRPEPTSAEDVVPSAPAEHEAEVPVSAEAAEAAAETAQAPAESPAESLDQLIDRYAAAQQEPAEGEVLDGHVVAVNDLGVVVDFGGKSEGLVPAQEFADAEAGIPFQPGDTIDVQLLNERKDGYTLLSHQRARRRRVWENIERSARTHSPLGGKIVDRIKGGLVVDVGIRAFLPASQVDLRPTRDLEAWLGKEISCRVLKMNRKRGNVVVSRRAVLEEELQAKRGKLLETLAEGAVLTGKVKNITDYGAFVDLGGLDGLLHVTDLAWGRVGHPSQVLSVGMELQVQVLKFDREKMRVSLGRKQLLPDPWTDVPRRYPAGTRIQGRVVGVTDYGAFVEIEPGVEGLVHVSEMSWSKRMKHPSKIVSVGDTVDVAVLDVKPQQRRISLGLKQTLPDPWESLAEKYPPGSIVSGRVRNLTEFGAFVEIEEGIDGLIHVSDISWTERVKHPGEKFKKGETVQAKVLKIDLENRRLSLGVKQVNDIWSDWFTAHRVNDVVRGRVARKADFGVFVTLADGIEGLCHISEIEGRRSRGEKEKPPRGGAGETALEVGQEYDFKILKLDPDRHKIGLSYRAAVRQAERREIEQYRSAKSSPNATIGDVILSKRDSS